MNHPRTPQRLAVVSPSIPSGAMILLRFVAMLRRLIPALPLIARASILPALLCGAGVAHGQIATDRQDTTDAQVATIRIGVLAKRGTERCLEKWAPTAEYLSAEIDGHRFEIVPLSFDEVRPAVERADVDFILANPAIYVCLESRHGVSRIATLKNRVDGHLAITFASVVFRLADRSDILSLADLKGKTFMAVKENSFGGWLMAWREMKEKGIDPREDFAELRFGGTHDAVVQAVLSGEVDAGSVRTDTLERMAMEGEIRLEDLHVIHEHGGGDVHLPFLHSTRAYPEWPMAKLGHTPLELAEGVADRLLAMPSDSAAAQAARCAGWTIPLNYQPVHECLKALSVEPYEDFGKITLRDVLRRYDWVLFLTGLAAMAVMGVVTVSVVRLNRSLAQAHSAVRESEERYRAVVHDSPVLICRFLPGSEITFVNDAYCEYFNKTADELVGNCFLSLIPTSEHEAVMKNIAALTVDSPTQTHEHQVIAPGGEIRWQQWTNRALFDERGLATAYQSIGSDITQRKRTVEALRESKQRFDLAVQGSADGLWEWQPDSGKAWWSPRYYELLGYEDGEIEPDFVALEAQLHPDDKQAVMQAVQDHFDQRLPYDIEYRLRTKPGEYRWFHVRGQALWDDKGTLLRMAGSLRDVTERKQAERTLQEERDFIRAIVDVAGALVVVLDRDGRIARFNRACEELTGYSFAEVQGREILDFLIPPEQMEGVAATIHALRSGDFPNSRENEWVAKDGSRRLLAWNNTCILDADGEVKYIVCIATDITERRRAENELRETKDFLENLITHANAPIVVWEPELRIGRFNRAFEHLTGYEAKDVIGKELSLLFPEQSREESLGKIARTAGGEHWESVEIPIRCKSGEVRSALWNSANIYSEDGTTLLATIAHGVDITERIEAEKALRESEERLRNIIEHSTNMFYSHTVDHVLTYVSPQVTEMLEREPREAMVRWTEFITDNPVNRRGYELTQKAIDTGERQESYELELITPKGRIVWVEVREAPVVEDGKTAAIVGSLTDITDRRRAEEDQRFLSSITRQVKDAILVTDLDFKTAYVNEAAEELFGYSRDELLGQSPDILNAEPMAQEIQADIYRTVSAGETWLGTHLNRRKDGSTFICELKIAPMMDENGRVSSHIGIMRDITDRIRAEQALRLTQFSVDHADDMIFWVSPEARFLYVNDRACDMLSYQRDELTGMAVHDIDPAHAEPTWRELWSECVQRRAMTIESTLLRKDGTAFPVDLSLNYIEFEGKEYMFAFGRNITERKQAEQALRESEERFRAIFETAEDSIFIKDRDLTYTHVNPAMARLFDRSPSEVVGRTDFELFGRIAGEHIRKTDSRVFQGQVVEEEDAKPVSDAIRAFHVIKVPMRDAAGEVIGLCGIARDITERKQAEQALQSQMETQKLLLRELDHRVRNNLASLVSLVDLTRGEESTVEQFAETITGRIQVMTIVHSILSQSHWLPVDLRSLIQVVIPIEQPGSVYLDGPDVSVVARQTTALGMVLHELMTNSVKYGALGALGGELRISWELESKHINHGKHASVLQVTWHETGGPVIEQQPTPRAGSGLIEGLVRAELQGQAELTYPPNGAQHRFTIRLDAIEADAAERMGVEPA
ncbi:MAG: PAS domain S-box protein [Phycisphaerales bacterium]|nr:PAS domain S-box protein [Phycisphaerales bacterium]